MPSAPTNMEQDFGPLLDTKIPENEKLAKSGKLSDAIENLLAVEKQTRNGKDSKSTGKVAITIVRLCYEAKQWDVLNECLVQLSKRREQSRSVISEMVQEATKYADQINEKDIKINLINTLRTITEGKIFVENERARLTKTLSKMKEDEGQISEAAKILQELQVETYGQMEKREKVDFLLEQMRLCLENKDYIRAQIISNKINRKMLQDEDMQDLKLRFYNLLIQYHSHEGQFLEIFKSYQSIYDTPNIKKEEAKWSPILKKLALYIIMSQHDNTQSDLLHHLVLDKNFEHIPSFRNLLKSFITEELIRWDLLQDVYSKEITEHFGAPPSTSEDKTNQWNVMHKRVIEHNIRVLSKYYTRITMQRLASLLDLDIAKAEASLSDVVSSQAIYAKIDRPAGIVVFVKKQDPSETLNKWADSVGDLLQLLEKTTHLIHREILVD